MLIYSALFNLCRLDRKRQAEAARMGIIVHFIKCIRDNSPLKQVRFNQASNIATLLTAAPSVRAAYYVRI